MQFYNTLTKGKEEFKPLNEGEVKMYVCGVTPYDYAHIGNARPAIVFDTLYRFFKAQGFKVTYVRNFTDVDDKIIARANEQGMGGNWQELTQNFIRIYHQDMAKLNVLGEKEEKIGNGENGCQILEPRVTDYIPQIINMVKTLLDKGIAYVGKSGDVLYDTTTFEDYGKLSGNTLSQLNVGQRIAVSEDKKNPTDFVLWKSAKEGEPMRWGFDYTDENGNSVNAGRPGWHIECSAMSRELLGESFDIHGGGEDLKFPHHECEIAQSKGACGKDAQFARYWMHNAFINVDGEKMSKSLGNFKTIHSLLENYSGEAIRLWMLSTHYRKPIDLTEEALEKAEKRVKKLYTALKIAKDNYADMSALDGNGQLEGVSEVLSALSDDLNTSVALAELESVARDIHIKMKYSESIDICGAKYKSLLECGKILGLLQQDPAEYLGITSDIPEEINVLVEKRKQAKAVKDWALADSLKAEIIAAGYEITDKADGTVELRKV